MGPPVQQVGGAPLALPRRLLGQEDDVAHLRVDLIALHVLLSGLAVVRLARTSVGPGRVVLDHQLEATQAQGPDRAARCRRALGLPDQAVGPPEVPVIRPGL
eukprot:13867573-Alexandrium_andersonii.AAC.1